MKAALPAYSEAIGEIFIVSKKVFLSRVVRCQEEEGGEDVDHVSGLGKRTGGTLLFSTTARFCDINEDETAHFDFKSDK